MEEGEEEEGEEEEGEKRDGGGTQTLSQHVIKQEDVVASCFLLLVLLLVSSKQSFSTGQSMILKDRNTRDHSAWTIGNRDPMHGMCIPHSITRA